MSRSEARALLARLGLDDVELSVLTRQGFLSQEFDKRGHCIFKLRFRLGQRQRVKFIGRDGYLARQIQAALLVWQRDRRVTLTVERLRREVSRQVREQLRLLEPILVEAGYRRHGREIRLSRKPRNSLRNRSSNDVSDFKEGG